MKRKKSFTFIIIVVILLAFVTIDNVGRFGITRSVLSYTKPVGTVFTDLGSGVSGFFRNIINVGSLQKPKC